jgi:hypothetical protein
MGLWIRPTPLRLELTQEGNDLCAIKKQGHFFYPFPVIIVWQVSIFRNTGSGSLFYLFCPWL